MLKRTTWGAVLLGLATLAQADVSVRFDLPAKEGSLYARPYVAVWVETPSGEPVQTLAVWHRQTDWLKDLTRWWRKIGRSGDYAVDAVAGATRQPGGYQLVWNGRNRAGQPVPPGKYVIQLEASREHGNRSLISVPIELGKSARFTHPAAEEIGPVQIQTGVLP